LEGSNIKKIEGVISVLLTPLSSNKVNIPELEKLIDYQMRNGVDGFFICGTMGEGPLLTEDQRKEIAEVVINYVVGKLPIIVHVGSMDTATAVRLAKHAEKSGADAIASVAPYYFLYDDASIIQHFKTIAESVSIPFFIYNQPALTGRNLTPELVRELIKIPTIQGIKDSSRSLEQISELVELKDDFIVLVGGDWLFLPALSVGAKGCISDTANLFPKIVVNVYKAFKEGDMNKAKYYHQKLMALRKIFRKGPYISNLKYAVELVTGIRLGEVIKPLRGLTEAEKLWLSEEIKKFQHDLHE